MTFEPSRAIADAVLYEGYVLYPYRASAAKNRVRWQFGILAPKEWSERGGPESWEQQTQCLCEADDDANLALRLRFLQVQAKNVEVPEGAGDGSFTPVESLWVDGIEHISWEEAVEHQRDFRFGVAELLASPVTQSLDIEGGEEPPEFVVDAAGAMAARVTRTRQPLHGVLLVSAERMEGPFGAIRLTVRIENLTSWDGAAEQRREAMSHSFVACHTLLALVPERTGRFISVLDPPEWARPFASGCANLHTFPVMVGDRGRADEVLSSPIILYDYPQIAPESPGDLFDGTEIDEILILRTMTLTDAEKAEARATDPKAAAIIDRVDTMPPELLDRLHGAVRYLQNVTGGAGRKPDAVPEMGTGTDGLPVYGEMRPFGEEFDSNRPAPSPTLQQVLDDAAFDPDTDAVEVAGVRIAAGDKVVLRPGPRRSDAQDMFLAGKVADVHMVFHDLENKQFLAVTLVDDPNADVAVSSGRFLYFSPDEVEALA